VNFFSDRIQMRKNSRMLQILNRKNKNRIIDLFLITHAFRGNKKWNQKRSVWNCVII